MSAKSRTALKCRTALAIKLAVALGIAVPSLVAAGSASAQTPVRSVNASTNKPDAERPFKVTPVATFSSPWAIAVLPDGRLLITEKPGRLYLVTQQGTRHEVRGVPKVLYGGQNGLLDVAISPRFATDRIIYFTYVEPTPGGGGLVLARARLAGSETSLRLADVTTLWRQGPAGSGGQPGGIIAFSPDGQHLFLTVGDRMRPETAQNPDLPLGKVLRLNLDGSTPADNPNASAGGVSAETWSEGHRNPYGLAFAPDGRLWLHEMGPRGGDELNLILPGRNYGWPIVSNGDNYDGTPIPDHDTRPEFAAPAVYWTPVIAPAGLVFYEGRMFPEWRGSALIGGLAATALVRVTVDPDGSGREVNRWDLGNRIRDVAVTPDGAVWLIEDSEEGRLLRLTPGKS